MPRERVCGVSRCGLSLLRRAGKVGKTAALAGLSLERQATGRQPPRRLAEKSLLWKRSWTLPEKSRPLNSLVRSSARPAQTQKLSATVGERGFRAQGVHSYHEGI